MKFIKQEKSKSKLRWKNLKVGSCPKCGAHLTKVGIMWNCTEQCGLKISDAVFVSIVGFEKSPGGRVYYVDGYTMGFNPSNRGGGYTISDERGNLVETKNFERSYFTNNDGEILGLVRALDICNEGDEIITDSRVAEIWVKSRKSKARPDLLPIIIEGNRLMVEKQVSIRWTSRERNLAGLYNDTHRDKY